MAIREYRDPQGTSWQIWHVKPTSRYTSAPRQGERRKQAAAAPRPDRRRKSFSLTPGLEEGWLCFESEAEKRRLTPVPSDWSTCEESALREYLDSAKPVTRRVIMQIPEAG